MASAVASLLESGRYDCARAAASNLVSSNPYDAEAWHSQGVLEAFQRDWEAAQMSLLRAVTLIPSNGVWWRDLGLAFLGNQQYKEAVHPLSRALEFSSDSDTMLYLAEALAGSESRPESWSLTQRVRRQFEPSFRTEFRLGVIFELLRLSDFAIKAYENAAQFNSKDVRPVERLLELYHFADLHEKCVYYATRTCRLKQYAGRSLYDLARAQFDLGRLKSSLLSYRMCLRRNPGNAVAHSAFLFSLLHDPKQTVESLRTAHEEWFRAHAIGPFDCHFPNKRDSNRRLRIGIPSGEFKETPTKYFVLPLLRAYDRSRLEIFCYHLVSTQDKATDEFQNYADHWRDLHGKTTQEIREAILADQIDILVDISGHFTPQPLDVFRRRAAPIQIAFPVYPATTGCKTIDYMLTDEQLTPTLQSEKQYSERSVVRLPNGYLVFQPPSEDVEVTPLPALTRGHITFGVFQRPAKCHSQFWEAAAGIMMRCPGSRLLIQHASRDLEQPDSILQRYPLQALAKFGVTPDRVDFLGVRSPAQHLETVSSVDIALDTWPYNGQTTTCCCLWMGVPVVTMAGETHASRTSLAVLHQVDMRDWVSGSIDEYISIGVEKACDIQTLSSLRASLRDRMKNAPICQPELVARDLEAAYVQMWNNWCENEGRIGADPPSPSNQPIA